MSKELEFFSKKVVRGLMDRRSFMGRAAALGVSATMANTVLAGAAAAQGAVKGGHLKAGLQGGESTNSLDPATWASDVPLNFGRLWGESIVEVDEKGEIEYRLAESVEASADAKTWTFKIREGVEFHNGKTLTPDDVVATLSVTRTKIRNPVRWALFRVSRAWPSMDRMSSSRWPRPMPTCHI